MSTGLNINLKQLQSELNPEFGDVQSGDVQQFLRAFNRNFNYPEINDLNDRFSFHSYSDNIQDPILRNRLLLFVKEQLNGDFSTSEKKSIDSFLQEGTKSIQSEDLETVQRFLNYLQTPHIQQKLGLSSSQQNYLTQLEFDFNS